MRVRTSGNQGYPPSAPSRVRLHRFSALPLQKHHLLLAGYLVFAAILFVAFIAFSFPYADTITALLAPMRLKVVFQSQEMNFPIGARFRNVRLIATPDDQLLLQSSDVTVSPGVFGLLFSRPAIRIRAQVFGGLVDATVRQRAPATLLNFELDSLKLVNISGVAGDQERHAATDTFPGGDGSLGMAMSGELSAHGFARVDGPDVIAASAGMTLRGSEVAVTIVNGLPPLELGVVDGNVLLERGVVSLHDLKAHGSDVDIEANGEIRLQPNLADSTVEVTLSLKPTAKGRASFGLFLKMLPHAPGEGPYHIQGPLTFPSLS